MKDAELAKQLAALLDLWCVCDDEGQIVEVSEPLGDLLGATGQALIGQAFRTQFDPGDWEAVQAACATAWQTGHPARFAAQLVTRGDEPTWAQWCATAQQEPERRLYVMGCHLTQQRPAVHRVAAQQARLEAIMQTAVDGIVLIDQQGLIQALNPAAERLFGYAASELIGCNVKRLMPPPYCDEHDDYLARYLQTGQPKIIGIGREVVGRRRDGSLFPMDLAVSEVAVDDGLWFTGIIRDITDRKRAEMELNELNEQLERRVEERTRELKALQAELVRQERLATIGRVSGGIAHEIRNPLNAIKTSAYFLLNARRPSLEKTREHLERIDRQVDVANHVVTALSEFARLPQPTLQRVELRQAWLEALQHTAIPAGIQTSLHVADDAARVLADPQQILIAFRNLIRNAVDAMPNGGILQITCERRDERVVVSVADSGVGIPAENLERIFEPLFSTKTRGIGLGLAITRAIVERNGGPLSVTSQLGYGSTFVVELNFAE